MATVLTWRDRLDEQYRREVALLDGDGVEWAKVTRLSPTVAMWRALVPPYNGIVRSGFYRAQVVVLAHIQGERPDLALPSPISDPVPASQPVTSTRTATWAVEAPTAPAEPLPIPEQP